MIFILLGLILGFLYGLQEEGFSFGILVALGGFLAGSFIWFIFGGIVGITLPTVDKVQEYELCALNDNISIQGRKYLFSGRIDGELVYRYIINTEKGKHIEESEIDNVYIKEGNYKPMIKEHTTDFKKDWYYLFCFPLFTDIDNYIEFYVPEGTVTNEYDIDLK